MSGAVVALAAGEQVVPEHRRALRDDKKSDPRSRSGTAQGAFTFWGHTAAPTSGKTVAPPAATSLIYNTGRQAQTPAGTGTSNLPPHTRGSAADFLLRRVWAVAAGLPITQVGLKLR